MRARGYIIKCAELVGLPGNIATGEAKIFMSLSRDGRTFNQERVINAGRPGERSKRLQWRPLAHIPNYAIMKFRGFDLAMPGFTRLELELEGMSR
jgi:hypothetical protein